MYFTCSVTYHQLLLHQLASISTKMKTVNILFIAWRGGGVLWIYDITHNVCTLYDYKFWPDNISDCKSSCRRLWAGPIFKRNLVNVLCLHDCACSSSDVHCQSVWKPSGCVTSTRNCRIDWSKFVLYQNACSVCPAIVLTSFAGVL